MKQTILKAPSSVQNAHRTQESFALPIPKFVLGKKTKYEMY